MKLHSKQIIAFVMLLFFLSGIVSSQENSHMNAILKTGVLRVGTSGTQPPYSVISRSGKLIGYEIDLSQILADAMGVKVEYVQKPFVDLLPALENGEIDVIMSGMTINPRRNIRVAFAGPYVVSGKSILAKAERLNSLDEKMEINRSNITLVVLEGTTSQTFAEKLAPNVKLVTTKDYDTGVKMILDNKADLMIADYTICIISILRYPESDLATLDEPLTIEPIGIALPPKEFLMHNMIDNYLRALDNLGILDEIQQKWFEDGSWIIRIP